MILYVNGDSHTAAAEAVNPHAFAEDDKKFFYMGRAPHPDNLAVSWCRALADRVKATLKCDAESASSNNRIIRSTREWLAKSPTPKSNILVIIQWSTWERQEWLIDGRYYQINASGIDDVPESQQDRYKNFIANVDWKTATESAHQQIWEFHQELTQANIRHVFFNGNNHFESIPAKQHQEWGHHYIGPYDSAMTFDSWLKTHNFETVSPNSWHFGRDAHAAWGRFMLQYIVQNQMV